MGAFESELLRHQAPRSTGEHRFRLFAGAALILFVAYLAATVAGAPRDASSLVFNIVVLPVPFLGWWAHARAPDDLRSTWLLCAWAATLWLVGSLVWYGVFLAEGSTVPHSPGVWDIFFASALLLLAGAVVAAMRSFVSLRIAALDACVIVAAGIALGAAFIGHGLAGHITPATSIALYRPVLGILTLTVIASAAVASWNGMPLSIALLGLGEIGLTIGSLIYSYMAVQGEFVDDRWANLGWAAGAGLCMLAGSVLILGVDRPVRFLGIRPMSRPAGVTRAALLVSLVAIAQTLGVTTYGLLAGHRNVAIIGLVSSVVVAVAMALRADGSIHAVEQSSALLDRALADSRHAHDDLNVANEQLRRANAELRTLQIAVAQGFNLIDERTQGRLRELVEEAGDDLAALVNESFED